MIVFFFQAEDGIRDGHVTGVQTCALPIAGLQRFPDDDGLTRLHLHALAEKGDASALLEQTEPRYRRNPGDLELGMTHAQALLANARYAERSDEHTSELQSRGHIVCRLLL